MSHLDEELKTTIRRNKLLGMWAAERLGLTGERAEAYSQALAVGTLDAEQNDVLRKIRQDFDAAGVSESDDDILRIMSEPMLKASGQIQPSAATPSTVQSSRWRASCHPRVEAGGSTIDQGQPSGTHLSGRLNRDRSGRHGRDRRCAEPLQAGAAVSVAATGLCAGRPTGAEGASLGHVQRVLNRRRLRPLLAVSLIRRESLGTIP
jgi:hypothetical protein